MSNRGLPALPAGYQYPNPGPLDGAPRFPGNGYPPRAGEGHAPEVGWPRLVRSQTIGKSGVLLYDAANTAIQPANVTMLSIGDRGAQSSSEDACPILLTLAPPRVIPMELADAIATAQNLSGEQSNYDVSTLDPFPGEAGPIVWPQLEAIIEWGTGGIATQARVDYCNGLTINLSASWLRVFAAAVPTSRSGVVGTSAAYWLAAFASLGWGRPGVAQKTVFVGDIDQGAESEVFSVPRFAKSAYVIGCDESASANVTIGTLRFWRSPDGTNNVGNFFVSGNQPSGFNVPNSGLYFSVLSGMTGSNRFAVVFDLAI